MKKLIFIIIYIVFTINAKAQVTLEQTYSLAGYYADWNSWQQLYIVKLEVDSDKLVFADKTNKLLKFYNLNYTPWKTISFAAATDLNPSKNFMNITYISQHLFDTDDEIEFLYVDQNSGQFITQVVNEDGSILFTATDQGPILRGSVPQAESPIYNTSAGTKLILSGSSSDSSAYVYSLAGTLTTGITAMPNNEYNSLRTSMAYPNPARSSTKIDYTLPKGVNYGELVFYDAQGKEVKRFNVDNTFNSLTISTEDLQSGVYYYNLQTAQGFSDGKKLVTIK